MTPLELAKYKPSGSHLEHLRTVNLEHGHAKRNKPSVEYRAWLSAKRRCFAPNDPAFEQYAGRGIMVGEEQRESYDTHRACLIMIEELPK